jgi:lambda repressor-like predicted transcriptional regulator
MKSVTENSVINLEKGVPRMYSNVKAELARKNESLIDLSKQTGIRYQSLVDKINGKYPITFEEAKKIKSALGLDIPLEELFEQKT